MNKKTTQYIYVLDITNGEIIPYIKSGETAKDWMSESYEKINMNGIHDIITLKRPRYFPRNTQVTRGTEIAFKDIDEAQEFALPLIKQLTTQNKKERSELKRVAEINQYLIETKNYRSV